MPNFLKDPKFTPIDLEHFDLKNYSPSYTAGYSDEKEITEEREENTEDISKLQEMLYAEGRKGLLLIFQAMDAAGKDSTIEHVMTGINPQGCHVASFKRPSSKELQHDFLWRCYRQLPERGKIGIFNRSYYEEVLVCKVHPEYVLGQGIGEIRSLEQLDEPFWQNRYQSIREMEAHLSKNGYTILKFFLNVSLEEQKNRFLKRINTPEKNWKFSYGDVEERKLWPKYMNAYQEMITETHSEENPWYIIPADHKWFMRYAVSEIIKDKMKSMNLAFPSVSSKQKDEIDQGKKELEAE